jgi:hypothetical protein
VVFSSLRVFVVAFDWTERGADVTQQMKHFGTSGEISRLIDEVNQWLTAGEGKIEIVAISESQGGRIGDEGDPFYFSLNVVYKQTE